MCWLQQSAELWHYPTFLMFPLLLVGCVECFAGYHAWRFLLGLNGAVLGFLAGVVLSTIVGASLLVLVAALAGAIVGATLFVAFVPLGTAVIAFGSVASFTILIGRMIGSPPAWYVPLASFVGAAAGIATLSLHRPMIIVLAAVAGAQQIAGAWTAYHLPFDSIPIPSSSVPSEWTIFLTLAGAGLLLQFATTG